VTAKQAPDQSVARLIGGGRMDNREMIVAKLAEWGIKLTDSELEQLLPAYENLLRWRGIVEDMLQSRKIADGMVFAESEPLLIHAIEKEG